MSYLATGLIIMWLILIVYMFRLTQEQRKVKKQLEEIKQHPG